MGCCARFKKWRPKGSTTHKQPPDSITPPLKLEPADKPVTSTPQEVGTQPENSPCQTTDATKANPRPEPKNIEDPVQLEEGSSPALKEPRLIAPTFKDTSPDLWQLSFDKLSTEEQGRLNALLKTDDALASDLASPRPFTNQSFNELIPIASAKQKELSDRAWEFEIRGRKIKPGDYTGRIIDCLTAVGDVGVGFMPQPASVVWPLVKGFMQVPVKADAETAAVLMTADILVRTITCGKGYESAYATKFEKIGPEIWDALQSALMELYLASLRLLALALEQCEKGTARRLVEAFLNPQKSQDQVSNLQDCHSNLRQVAQACQAKIVGDVDKSMTEFLEKFAGFNVFVESNFSELFEQIEGRRRTEILDWISKAKPFDRHSTTTANRAPDTCGWLLRSKYFIDWEQTLGPAVIWLQGSPGTGKTFLTSSVIDHLHESLKADEGLAFYYCRRSGDKLEGPNDIIRSIFRQLATRALKANSHQMRKDVQDLFTKSKDDMSHPAISTCKLQILKSIDHYSRITLVIDALDECAEPKKELFDLIESMVSQLKYPMRVFLSARPNFGVEDRFPGKATIKTELHQVESDIEKFIHHEIDEFPKWELISQEVQLDAIESLKQKSQGMFQWVSLHIEQLRTCEMDDDVVLLIEKMPKGLPATYQQIYDQISKHPSQKTIADRAFLWLMYSSKAMNTEEMLEAICHDADHNHSERRIGKDRFLTLCKNLVVFDESTDRFRFCHASVSEYIADGLWTPANAHCYAAKTCLRLLFLMYDETADATCDLHRPGSVGRTVKELVAFPKILTFHHYCRQNWFYHIQCYEAIVLDPSRVEPNLVSLLKLFLKSPLQSGQVYESWYRDFAYDLLPESRLSVYQDISPSSLPILAMCRFAIGTSLLAEWWSITGEISSQVNSENETLLILAVKGGSLQICEALVKSNVPIDHIGRSFSALHHAADLRMFEIARMLLENGAAVDLKDNQSRYTPLILAAQNGDLQMVQLLVERGASIDYVMPGDDWGTALGISVSRGGDIEVARFLIDNGADVNFTGCLPDPKSRSYPKNHFHPDCRSDESILARAIWAGKLETSQLLIEGGADVDKLSSGIYGSALAIAARTGNLDIAELLIDHGADVNKVFNGAYGSSLAVAAYSGNFDIAELLIMHGADVNMALNGACGSALAAAASHDELEIAELLIMHGADVNMELAGAYGSALAAAVASHRVGTLQLLIEKGAQPNTLLKVGVFGSALAAAGSVKIARILIENGANVDLLLETGQYGNALAAAAAEDKVGMIDYLVSQGANVNLPLVNGIYGAALHAACYWGQINSVRRLLNAGAIISLPEEHCGFKDAFEAARAETGYEKEDIFKHLAFTKLRRRAEFEADKRTVGQLLIDHLALSERLGKS